MGGNERRLATTQFALKGVRGRAYCNLLLSLGPTARSRTRPPRGLGQIRLIPADDICASLLGITYGEILARFGRSRNCRIFVSRAAHAARRGERNAAFVPTLRPSTAPTRRSAQSLHWLGAPGAAHGRSASVASCRFTTVCGDGARTSIGVRPCATHDAENSSEFFFSRLHCDSIRPRCAMASMEMRAEEGER